MEQYELGAAAALERIVALQREATQARLAKSWRPTAASPGRGGTTMLTEHQHKPGEFDPGHCQDCARETDLLDHYHHVQRQEQTVGRPTGGLGRPAAIPPGPCGPRASGSSWQPSPC